MPNETLVGRVRPIVGGLAQAVTFNGVTQTIPWCTYSFSARYNGVDVVLTASHCTSRTYENDATPTVFYQNSVTAADLIGSEWHDPLGFDGCVRPEGYYFPCKRYSDAAMIRYDPSVIFDLGFIARTTSRSTAWGVNGSKTIDSANPRFRIINTRSYPLAGERVDKVGWRTGWTSGTVLSGETCVDALGADGYWRLCTYRADYWADEGDSGAPIFIWSGSGSNVTLVGIHWGNNLQRQSSSFSPMGGVYQDFGSMTVEKPLLSVQMSGLGSAPEFSSVNVTATVSNGASPFTYAWTVNGAPACGNSDGCTATLGAAGTYTTFAVTVTDAGGETASNSHSVFAEFPGCPDCLKPRLPGGGLLRGVAVPQRSGRTRLPVKR